MDKKSKMDNIAKQAGAELCQAQNCWVKNLNKKKLLKENLGEKHKRV